MCPRQRPHAKYSFDNDSTRIFSPVQNDLTHCMRNVE